jgi:hypothetical protein
VRADLPHSLGRGAFLSLGVVLTLESRSLMPSNVVDTLRAQHRELERLSAALDQELRGGDLPALLRELVPFRRALLSHLELKNTRFYPQLFTMAKETDLVSADLVHALADAMRALTGSVLQFVERHHSLDDVQNLSSFRVELRTLLQILEQRLHDEEHRLHTLYSELQERFARTG